MDGIQPKDSGSSNQNDQIQESNIHQTMDGIQSKESGSSNQNDQIQGSNIHQTMDGIQSKESGSSNKNDNSNDQAHLQLQDLEGSYLNYPFCERLLRDIELACKQKDSTEVDEITSVIEEREDNMVDAFGSTCIFKRAKFLRPCIASASEAPKAPTLSPEPPFSSVMPKFQGWRKPQKVWIEWFDKLVPLYGSLWKEIGIYNAIKSCTYKIKKDRELVMNLLQFWCFDTNTFVFEWGEATVTLEDMMIIGGYPVIGKAVPSPVPEQFTAIEKLLTQKHLAFRRSTSRRATYAEWIHYFMRTETNTVLEHIAFLSLWLSRFVFPTRPTITLGRHVFPVAIHLGLGIKMALAPAVLASLYKDMKVLKEMLYSSSEHNDVWAPFQLLKMWALEHFPKLSSRMIPYSLSPNEPRAALWRKQKIPYNVEKVKLKINSHEDFLWRPYTAVSPGWHLPSFYRDCIESNREDENEELQCFARCLKPCIIVGLDGSGEKYFPHRVARQFGFDQDIPAIFLPSNAPGHFDWKPVKNAMSLIRSRFLESRVTKRYHEWWTSSTVAHPDGVRDPSAPPLSNDKSEKQRSKRLKVT